MKRSHCVASGLGRALPLVALAIVAGSAPAAAGPVGGVIGADYFTTESGRAVRSAVAAVGTRAGNLGFGGALNLYDDDARGSGVAATAVVSGYGAGVSGVRALGTAWFGEGDYRAWRIAAGPLFHFPNGSSVHLFGARFEEDGGLAASEFGGDAVVEFPGAWNWRAAAAYASHDGGGDGLRAATGFGVRVAPKLELSLEGGVTRGATSAGGATAGGGGLLAPLRPQGDGSISEVESRELEGTLQLGLRVSFP